MRPQLLLEDPQQHKPFPEVAPESFKFCGEVYVVSSVTPLVTVQSSVSIILVNTVLLASSCISIIVLVIPVWHVPIELLLFIPDAAAVLGFSWNNIFKSKTVFGFDSLSSSELVSLLKLYLPD